MGSSFSFRENNNLLYDNINTIKGGIDMTTGAAMVLAWFGMMVFMIAGLVYIGIKMVVDDIMEKRS